MRTFLILLFSSLWVTHPMGIGFDFIMIVPLPPFLCSFFFVFGHGSCFSFLFFFFFFGGFQNSPINGCSTASCNFVALTGGDEHTSFFSAILNQKAKLCFLRRTLVASLQRFGGNLFSGKENHNFKGPKKGRP